MGKSMARRTRTLVKFQIEQLNNDTYLATLVAQSNKSLGMLSHKDQPYDDEGALYYVVAVVFIYGFSIILMIGSLIKRNKNDNGVSKYMKDMDKVRRMERRQQKYQTRLAMSAAGGSRRASRALAARGSHWAVDSTGPLSAPALTRPSDDTFNWDTLPTDKSDSNMFQFRALHSSLGSSTDESSPKLMPGKASPVPPKTKTDIVPLLGNITDHSDTITIPESVLDSNDSVFCENTCTELSERTAISPKPSPNGGGRRQIVYLQPIFVHDRQQDKEDSSNSPPNDTVLYLDGEEKCQVALKHNVSLSPQRSVSPSSLLGTLHEVEEEQQTFTQGKVHFV